MSSSSDRDEREIDEYYDESNSSYSSSENSSSESDSTDKQYSSGVPLEVLQEEIRRKAAFGLFASPSTSVQPSTPFPNEEEDILYCCAMDNSIQNR